MANFYGTARTNYFKVKDIEAFKDFVNSLSNCTLLEDVGKDEQKLFGFYSDCDSGCFPSSYNEETDEHEDIDIVEETAKHLAEGEVAVFMEAGGEKCRYISGWATAINDRGDSIYLSLNDIYKMAEDKFGVKPTMAEF